MSLTQDLQTKGYVYFITPHLSAHVVRELLKHFYHFVEYPPAGHIYFINTRPLESAGLTTKDGTDGSDVKTIFHYRPSLAGLLATYNPALLHNERWRRLLELCQEVARACNVAFFQFLSALEMELPEEQRIAREVFKNPLNVLRLLAYTDDRPGEPGLLAREHTDETLGTLVFYESHPGLEARIPDTETWERVTPWSGRPAIFGGEALAKLTQGVIPAVCHRVCSGLADDRVTRRIKRSSIVFFAQMHLTGDMLYPQET